MSAEAKNMRAIYNAIDHHNANCDPAHTILMHPIEIERMEWEEGDTIRGCTLKADRALGTGSFRLLCDKPEGNETEEEQETVATDTRDKVFA